MSLDACILTTKDVTILEVMLERRLGTPDPLRTLLRRKIDMATVMFADDLPPGIASIGSRLGFRVDGGATETRVLAQDRMDAPVGMFLSITALRGLALLGLAEGQRLLYGEDGEQVLLETVFYQPEAARRAREAAARLSSPESRRASLRLVGGDAHGRTGPAGDFDDPGPSAA